MRFLTFFHEYSPFRVSPLHLPTSSLPPPTPKRHVKKIISDGQTNWPIKLDGHNHSVLREWMRLDKASSFQKHQKFLKLFSEQCIHFVLFTSVSFSSHITEYIRIVLWIIYQWFIHLGPSLLNQIVTGRKIIHWLWFHNLQMVITFTCRKVINYSNLSLYIPSKVTLY